MNHRRSRHFRFLKSINQPLHRSPRATAKPNKDQRLGYRKDRWKPRDRTPMALTFQRLLRDDNLKLERNRDAVKPVEPVFYKEIRGDRGVVFRDRLRKRAVVARDDQAGRDIGSLYPAKNVLALWQRHSFSIKATAK